MGTGESSLGEMWKQRRRGSLIFRSQAEESISSKETEKEQPVRKEKHLS